MTARFSVVGDNECTGGRCCWISVEGEGIQFLGWVWLTWQRRRQWHPTPALLPGKSHGWRSLVGCGPWGRKELVTTERLHFHFSLSCTGEGNGNPLQCSCLENRRDGGAWWAATYGVAQSRTRLKWLSSIFLQNGDRQCVESNVRAATEETDEQEGLEKVGWGIELYTEVGPSES